jgi:uncharacterized protein (TIGR03492 family)
VTDVLFLSNGHGEASIADRIAVEMKTLAPQIRLDHLALVGDEASAAESMRDVGPRRAMPSGGLIAMGNVRNIIRDLRAGLLGLTLAQRRFLRAARGDYDATVAVGDAFALLMALEVRAPTVFVGTAKSVNVAPYGALEERLLRRAAARFVRDEATARRLAARGLAVEPAANVIVDLFTTADDARAHLAVDGFSSAIALFPGSRTSAYDAAAFLLRVTRDLARDEPSLGAVLSLARGLDAQCFAASAQAAGWDVSFADGNSPIVFSLSMDGRARVRGWRGPLGPILTRVMLVLGQAGTANEAAAAAGVPVVAFEDGRERKSMWYRRRQRGLLGDALAVLPANVDDAVAGVRALLHDPATRAHMAVTGRSRMGESGAARRIAERVTAIVREKLAASSEVP